MSYVYVVKNEQLVLKEALDGVNSTKKQLGGLYRKYGTNRIFIRKQNPYRPGKFFWERVELVWNSRCTDIKSAKLFLIRVKELPKILQMMELTGAT